MIDPDESLSQASTLIAASPGAYRELGPFHLVQQIGAGGMGVVYRGQDARDGRDRLVGPQRVSLNRPEPGSADRARQESGGRGVRGMGYLPPPARDAGAQFAGLNASGPLKPPSSKRAA